MNGYVEAVISSFILIFISVMLSLLERKTKFGKWKNAVRQILIGVVFGVSAILTSKISEVSGAGFIFNISESFSVCAALAFGWPAGIVCASVSGCESLMKFLYVSGNVTYLSDFITIMFAGLTAAVLQRLFGKNRRPSLFFVVVFCVVIESTHLLMIFLTNMQNIGEAYEIVKNNIAVLIISNVLVVSISLILCALVRKEPYKFINKKSERSISSVIEKSIIISILIAYSFTGVLTFFMMDNIIRLQTRDTLFASILSLESEMGNVVENKIYYNIMDLLYTGNNESAGVLTEIQNIAPDGVASADVSEINSLLQKYSVKSGFKEINAISKNRIIMYSNVESNVGSKVDDELIFQETDDIGKYVEMMIGDEGDEMCACVKTDINSESSEYIEYFQVVYDDEYLTNLEEEYIRSSSETLMIGSTGFFIVVKAEPVIDWEPQNIAFVYGDDVNVLKNAVAKNGNGTELNGTFTYNIPELTAGPKTICVL